MKKRYIVLIALAVLVAIGSMQDRQQPAQAQEQPVVAKVDPGNRTDAVVHARLSVKRLLKTPASAEFSGDTKPVLQDGVWLVRGYVNAQNTFGAMIRSTYACRVQFTGQWTLTEPCVVVQ